MDKYKSRILNKLLDKYESSKTFLGDNQNRQSFSVSVVKEFPKYADDSDYESFEEINRSINELLKKEFVYAKQKANGVFTGIYLNIEKLEPIYEYVKRLPKREEVDWLNTVLEEIRISQNSNPVLKSYAQTQEEKIKQNKNVEFYTGDRKEFTDLLKAAQFALENGTERFVREVSMELFQDSKRLEQIAAKVKTLIFHYGDFAERENVLEELGIVRTPTYMMLKGNAFIQMGTQKILLSELNGDIGFSTRTAEEIQEIQVLGQNIITIENLTTFHNYAVKEDFCIYLGGFHNRLKQKVIVQLYQQNKSKRYFHFGDIDAGGFYIFEHLCRKTGVPFKPMYMDVETLKKYKNTWKPLTDNDRKRLRKLNEKEKGSGFADTIEFMLEHNCKLEQEAIM